MAKKKSSIGLYFIGMVLVIVGCFLPLTAASNFGLNGHSAFDAIKASGSGILKVGSIFALVGAIAGVIFCFVSVKGLPLKLVSLVVSVVGGIYVILNYMNIGGIGKSVLKFANNVAGTSPAIGMLVIFVGWLLAIFGFMKEK